MAQQIGDALGPQPVPSAPPAAVGSVLTVDPADSTTWPPHYPHPGGSVSTPLPDLAQQAADAAGQFLDTVKPGWQTSEAKITVAALTVLNLLFTLFLAGVFGHTDQATVITATAVDGAVTSLLTGTYAKSRSDLKAAVATARIAAASSNSTS